MSGERTFLSRSGAGLKGANFKVWLEAHTGTDCFSIQQLELTVFISDHLF